MTEVSGEVAKQEQWWKDTNIFSGVRIDLLSIESSKADRGRRLICPAVNVARLEPDRRDGLCRLCPQKYVRRLGRVLHWRVQCILVPESSGSRD